MKKTALALACSCLLDGCAILETEAAVVGCQTADYVTTMRALELGGREANPVVAWLLERFGPGGFLAAKSAATAVFLGIYSEVPSGLVILVNGLTCGVAAHNARIVSELERKRTPSSPSGSPAPSPAPTAPD